MGSDAKFVPLDNRERYLHSACLSRFERQRPSKRCGYRFRTFEVELGPVENEHSRLGFENFEHAFAPIDLLELNDVERVRIEKNGVEACFVIPPIDVFPTLVDKRYRGPLAPPRLEHVTEDDGVPLNDRVRRNTMARNRRVNDAAAKADVENVPAPSAEYFGGLLHEGALELNHDVALDAARVASEKVALVIIPNPLIKIGYTWLRSATVDALDRYPNGIEQGDCIGERH